MHLVTTATATLPGADFIQILQFTHTMNYHIERIWMEIHLGMPSMKFLLNTQHRGCIGKAGPLSKFTEK